MGRSEGRSEPQEAWRLVRERDHRVDDPWALRAPDPKHSTASEERTWLIGEADNGVLVVVFTIRQPRDCYRLISARRASRRERERYAQSKGIPV